MGVIWGVIKQESSFDNHWIFHLYQWTLNINCYIHIYSVRLLASCSVYVNVQYCASDSQKLEKLWQRLFWKGDQYWFDLVNRA